MDNNLNGNVGTPAGDSGVTGNANNAVPGAGNEYTGAANNGGILNGYVMDANGYTQSFSQGNPGGGAPQAPKKKNIVLPIVLGVVGVLVVVGGVLGFVFRGVLANAWARMTKSPEEYTRYVLEKNLIDNDALWKNYEESYDQMADLKGIKVSGEVRLEMSKDVIGMIEDAYTDYQNKRFSYSSGYEYYDAYYEYIQEEWEKDNYDYLDYEDWVKTYDSGDDDDGGVPAIQLGALSDIALIYELERNEDTIRAMEALQLSDDDYLLTMNEIYDSDKSELYLQMPEINKDYAKIELDEFLDEDELEQVNDVLFSNDRLEKQLIEPKVARSMYKRYMDVLLSAIDDVDEKTDTLEVAGEEQKCVALKFTVDGDTAKETARGLIETMMDDDDLRQYLTDYMSSFYMSSYLPTQADDFWDEFVEEMEQALEDLDDQDMDGELECTIYVSNLGTIIGLNMESDDGDEVFFGYVVNKGKLYAEARATQEDEDVIRLEGTGKVGTSGASVDFTLYLGQDIDREFEFALSEVTPKGGVFTMDLSQFYKLAQDDIDEEMEDFAKLIKDGTLRIEYHGDGKKLDTSVAIMDDDDKVIGISWKMEVGDAGKMELPSSKETETVKDEDDLVEYLLDSDLDVFVDKLEVLGLPKDSADEMREEIEEAKQWY